MNLINKTVTAIAVSVGATLLTASANAMPLATASLAYTGKINLSATNGVSISGSMNAQYRTPPEAAVPYQFNTSLSIADVTAKPELTVTTPELLLIPGEETCLPFIGCFTTPDITLPSQTIPLAPTIPLVSGLDIYDLSYTSDELPLGEIFTLDFGTPLLGEEQTLDTLLREQFETGATSVSESGTTVGPIDASYSYLGVLQPDGETILGDYALNLNSPELLAELESSILDVVNDNTDFLGEIALNGLLATDPCGGLPIGQSICNTVLNNLNGDDLQVTLNSLGEWEATFDLNKSIIPQIPQPPFPPTGDVIPTPGTLPLLLVGIALTGLGARRPRS